MQNLKPLMNIGKNGATASVIEEIKKQLKKRRIIKIRMLPSVLEGSDRKLLARELADKTDSELISQVGFTLVLKKK